jgi:MazG family protein
LIENWEKTKENERNKKGFNSLLDDIPIALPELMRAIKLQKRAARVNFDWPNIDGVLEKIAEESKELSEAIEIKSYDSVKEEMGDLLFTLVNLSRKLNVDPELALRETNTKFIKRFSFIESAINNNGENINFVSQNKLENLWLASKTIDA